MQLILTQTDIETALVNYVNGIMTVKDGNEITVELKATRGDTGATAIIDISPAKAEVLKEPVKNTGTQVKAKPVVTETAKEVVTKAADPEPEVLTKALDPDPQVEPETEPEVEVPEAEEEPEPVVEKKPASLFANLKKPKND